jgi:hypothetical protein
MKSSRSRPTTQVEFPAPSSLNRIKSSSTKLAFSEPDSIFDALEAWKALERGFKGRVLGSARELCVCLGC